MLSCSSYQCCSGLRSGTSFEPHFCMTILRPTIPMAACDCETPCSARLDKAPHPSRVSLTLVEHGPCCCSRCLHGRMHCRRCECGSCVVSGDHRIEKYAAVASALISSSFASCSGVGFGFDGLSVRLCRRVLRLVIVDVVLVESTEAESDFMVGFSEYMVELRSVVSDDGRVESLCQLVVAV